MTTVLVTGGCGFMGSHFIRLVLRQESWRVVNLDKLTYAGDLSRLADIQQDERYRFVRGDIGDRRFVQELFEDERPWAVVNFAAESHVDRSILDPTPFLQTNLLGTQVLLEAAHTCAVQRFLQISTDEVYGDAEGKEPFSEESALQPSSPYSASKAAADLLCLAYKRTYKMSVLIVRSSNNYGPFQFPEKLIPLMIRNSLKGLELPVYGDGGQRRDWLHVDDSCRAVLEVLQRGRQGEIYNIGTGTVRTNLEVIRAVCVPLARQAGSDIDSLLGRVRYVSDRPGHDRCYALDTRKIRKELGWVPQVSFESAVEQTVQWYIDHQHWVDRAVSEEYQTYYDAIYGRAWQKL
jgi:dTDP-glucose 4,6-dehydratase